MKFETLAIHAGQEPDPNNGAVMTPVYFTSTYMQDGVAKPRQGYDYSRTMNPTRKALQDCLAALEGGSHGLAFSSGLAATDTVLRLLDSDSHVLAGNDVYGGTFRVFDKVLRGFKLDFTFADTTDPESVAEAITPSTRLVWLESPTNPYLRITDIRAVAEIVHAHENNPILVVDNTFATPYLQRPLELGADIVVHSMTKYLGGHSDVVGGFVATNDPTVAERLYFLQKSLGAVPGPFDCWLVLRGLKTLAIRMRKHTENAKEVAEYLSTHQAVETVLYPGLPDHPGHNVAKRQMDDFGGMISFLAESEEAAVELVARTKVWALAESLGGGEGLIEHPARMTHASTADAPFAAPRELVPLSVGIESPDDLIADLEEALVPAAAPARA